MEGDIASRPSTPPIPPSVECRVSSVRRVSSAECRVSVECRVPSVECRVSVECRRVSVECPSSVHRVTSSVRQVTSEWRTPQTQEGHSMDTRWTLAVTWWTLDGHSTDTRRHSADTRRTLDDTRRTLDGHSALDTRHSTLGGIGGVLVHSPVNMKPHNIAVGQWDGKCFAYMHPAAMKPSAFPFSKIFLECNTVKLCLGWSGNIASRPSTCAQLSES